MMLRISSPLGRILFFALSAVALSAEAETNAWAQLTSQTALVGTVTDRDGGVVPVLAESLIVTASAAVLATDSVAVSQTITERAVVDLPLSGRNVWSLASTTPGVLTGLNSDIGLSFRGAGQREIQNSLSLDGINSSSNLLAMTSMRPIVDAVEEIQVQTGSTSAEYGVGCIFLGGSCEKCTRPLFRFANEKEGAT
jgi:hypothetical protein